VANAAAASIRSAGLDSMAVSTSRMAASVSAISGRSAKYPGSGTRILTGAAWSASRVRWTSRRKGLDKVLIAFWRWAGFAAGWCAMARAHRSASPGRSAFTWVSPVVVTCWSAGVARGLQDSRRRMATAACQEVSVELDELVGGVAAHADPLVLIVE
jgi:hypothetical protein